MNRHTTGHLSACAVLALLIACTATDTPAGPDTPAPPPPPATGTFVLPVSGTWQVIQAPPCVTGSNHCETRSQIYAIDVVAVNDFNGAPVSCTGRPVLAPTAGDVVSAVDGQPDTGGSNPATPAGNHIVIRRSPQEFVFVAHLQRGTVAVSTGSRVTAGQMIGRCGNSGNSSGPHVHFHMQSTAGVLDYFSATPLPMVFDRVVSWDFNARQCVTTTGASLTRGMFLC